MANTQDELQRIAILELDEVKAKDLTNESLVLISNPSLNSITNKYISKKLTTSNLSTYIIGSNCLSLDQGLKLRFLWDGYYEDRGEEQVLSCKEGFFINKIVLNENGVPKEITQDTLSFLTSNYGGGVIRRALKTDIIELTSSTIEYTILSTGWVVFNGEIIEDSSESAYTEIYVNDTKIALWNNVGAFDGIKTVNYSSSGMPIGEDIKVTIHKSNNTNFNTGSKINISYFELSGVCQEKSLNRYVLKSYATTLTSDAKIVTTPEDGYFVTNVSESDGKILVFKAALPETSDTTNTTGTTIKDNNKLFLVGATNLAYAVETNTNSKCYINSDNCLYSNGAQVITKNTNNRVAETGSYNDLLNKPDISTAALVVNLIYPIGSIYLSLINTNPAQLFNVGEWKKIACGRCLWGANENGSNLSSIITAGLPNITASTTVSGGTVSFSGTTNEAGEHKHKTNCAVINDAALDGSGLPVAGGSADRESTKAGSHTHTFSGTASFSPTASTTLNKSSIYGASNTVQPPALVVNMWQRVK